MALHNSISKASGKTRFLKRKEHADFLHTLSLAAAVTHFDFVCQLYDKYIVNEKATTHLVTLYEDRLRHDWARRCEDGDVVNLDDEAGKLNKSIMNACKTRIEAVLKNAGINTKGVKSESPSEHRTGKDAGQH